VIKVFDGITFAYFAQPFKLHDDSPDCPPTESSYTIVCQPTRRCDPPDARRQHGDKSDQLIGLNHRMPHSSQTRYRVFMPTFCLDLFLYLPRHFSQTASGLTVSRLHLDSLSADCIWTHCQQTETLLVVGGWVWGVWIKANGSVVFVML
ncbi:hypothetical protein Bpfe_027181, partial [Biomphalaria pfeifferi]